MIRNNKTGMKSLVWLLAAVVAAIISGCGGSDSPAQSSSPNLILTPSRDQLSLDLPNSVAPQSTPSPVPGEMLQQGPPCDGEDFPGPMFACITRYVFSQMGVGFADMMFGMLDDIAQSLSSENIPQGQTFQVSDGGFTIEVWWNENASGTHFMLDFFDPETTNRVASWTWDIGTDGSANGDFKMVSAAMGGGDAPQGLHFTFSSNADGSEKSISMDIDIADTPPDDDPGAPTALKLTASKSAGMWTVQYGMYNPTWLSPEIVGGVATSILVKAVAGVANDSPGVMEVIALDGAAQSIPVNAAQDNSLCSYLVPIFEGAGMLPPGTITCGDNNPYYISGDGTVQEGGSIPAGMETLATALTNTSHVVSDPTTIRDLLVSF